MRRLFTSMLIVLVLALGPLAPSAGAAAARDTSASQNSAGALPCPPEGLWLAGPGGAPQLAPGCSPGLVAPGAGHSQAANPGRPALANSTGGPDDFGYTWNDGVPLNWIDATGGTDTGLSGTSDGSATGSISLPFSFKYYEHSYNSVFIAASGYLAFSSDSNWPWQGLLPTVRAPNNEVAPYWAPFTLKPSGKTGRVFYASGGSTPNRYFVAEWNQVGFNKQTYTFEAILQENGDMVFQYQAMGQMLACATAGIEDAAGLDGLAYLPFCASQALANKAVRFSRPPVSARVRLYPPYQGSFGQAGETVAFTVPVENTGDLGSDRFDVSDTSAWPVSLFAADGVTPLSDTGGNSSPDTGLVAPVATVNIVVKVSVPGGASLGDRNDVNLTFRSALNSAVSKPVVLQIGVPTTFAQVFMDLGNGAQSLYLAGPSAHALRQVTASHSYGFDSGVAEAPNGNLAYVWYAEGSNANPNITTDDLEYTILNRFGETVHAVAKLTNNSSATTDAYDISPAVAVGPDGSIGITWVRELYDSGAQLWNYNIFYAALDSAGNLASGPINLTNNGAWFSYSRAGIDLMGHPVVAATGDNHFVFAWLVENYIPHNCPLNCYTDELMYAVRTTGGAQVRAATLLAPVPPGSSSSSFHNPGLAALAGNRALLTFDRFGSVKFLVFDSSANIVQGGTNLASSGFNPDAAQLSDSNIVVAWSTSTAPYVAFAVLNAGYGLVSGPTTLPNPADKSGSTRVSVAADSAGRAALTWTDNNLAESTNIYYALVNGAGSILTQPLIFQSSALPAEMYIDDAGYGSTSLSPEAGVDTWVQTQPSDGASPGGSGVVPVSYGNHGTTTANSVTITLTLGVSLTYLSDTSGFSPSQVGNNVIWTLPDLGWLSRSQFNVVVGIPNVAYGTTFPVGLAIGSNAPDVNSGDNLSNGQVFAAHLLFLPANFRP